MYQFHLSAILSYLPLLPKSIGITLLLSALTLLASTLLAFPIAKARLSGIPPLALLARAYVELFRNIPILVLLYVYYFGLAEAGLHLSVWSASLLALVTNAAAYGAEILRSGYSAIATDQREAARALGLRGWQTEAFIVLPQVWRVVIPSFGNHCVGILLGSSIAAVLGVPDVADWMLNTGSGSFRYMESFLVAAVVYVVLCQSVAAGMAALDRRRR